MSTGICHRTVVSGDVAIGQAGAGHRTCCAEHGQALEGGHLKGTNGVILMAMLSSEVLGKQFLKQWCGALSH